MAIKFSFTSPISLPAVDGISVFQADGVNDEAKTITLALNLMSGSFTHPQLIHVTIKNGSAECLIPNISPHSIDDLFSRVTKTTDDNPALATAFDTVMGNYFMAGNTGGILEALETLGIIPAGTV